MTEPQIIAHRGATYLAPENTLTAFQNAIVLGADGVEMDVQQTKDQGLIIHHDYLIDLGTKISAKIYDLTLGELEDIDLTKWNGVDFTTEKLPTLAEALAFCSGLEGCTVQLELKAPILRIRPSCPAWWSRSGPPALGSGCSSSPSGTTCSNRPRS